MCKKSCPIIYVYNNEKKYIVLGHLSYISGVTQIPRVIQIPGVTQIPRVTQTPGVSQGLRDITQAYIEIVFAIYHPYYKENSRITKSVHNY